MPRCHLHYLNCYAILPFCFILATIIKEQCSSTVKPKKLARTIIIKTKYLLVAFELVSSVCVLNLVQLTFRLSSHQRILTPKLREVCTPLLLPFYIQTRKYQRPCGMSYLISIIFQYMFTFSHSCFKYDRTLEPKISNKNNKFV